ncbi:MAG TPA: acyltransferase, partial [Micropepsaceae bacterium]|nr:acyltransferase [Micropepsaceae bacterium]
MNKETSIYLDAVRFIAALFVFIDHLSGQRLTGGFLWQLAPAGGEAVIVFFILSGFVIGYVTDTRERDFRTYAVNRMARILSVAVPALALTFVLDSIGFFENPGLYLSDRTFLVPSRLVQYSASALFVHQLWGINITPGTILAYWSLGYEVWYYLIFAVAVFAPPKYRWIGAAAAVLIAGPKIALLLPIWLAGVGLYRLCSKHVPPPSVGWAMFAGSILLWVSFEVWCARYGRLFIAPRYLLPRIEIPQDYIVACLFAANLYGFRAISHIFRPVFLPVERIIRWMAGATFSLYLIHQPVTQIIVSISPWSTESWPHRALVTAGTLVVVFLFAEFTERKKNVWRHWIEDSFAAIRAAINRGRES